MARRRRKLKRSSRFRRALLLMFMAVILIVGGVGVAVYLRNAPTLPKLATVPPSIPPPKTPSQPQPSIPRTEGFVLQPLTFAKLPSWQDDDHRAAISAFHRSCEALSGAPSDHPLGSQKVFGVIADWRAPCMALNAALDPKGATKGEIDRDQARSFFERWFIPYGVRNDGQDEGLFTGYFEVELKGSRRKSGPYVYPLYAIPPDLVTVDLGRFKSELQGQTIIGRVDGKALAPYFTRHEIDAGILSGKRLEIFWINDPLDVFILHIQGSGKVLLPDGKVVRVGFAGHNGHGYTSIGKALIDRGALKPEEASWTGIKAWLDSHPSEAANALAVNARYIFFRQIDGDGPLGAQGVPLTPGRSLAVDTAFIPLGVPIWLDTVGPGGNGAPLRRLMVAQDKGAAIKGAVRGDFFWGAGASALAEAGRMKSKGRWFLLLPKSAAP